jgi:glycosyltransferase involved in cell wall biosynthesis
VNKQPHVLVDATAIPANRGGVGRYLECLLPALVGEVGRLTVVVQPRDEEWMKARVAGAFIVACTAAGRGRGLRLAWEQFGLPRLARLRGADVIFSPHYTMPVLAGRPVVVTVHDTTFFSHPRLHSRLKGLFFRFWIRRSVARAAACIVPSEATRSELLRLVSARNASIAVAHHGVDVATFHSPKADEKRIARELVGSDSWVAFLGTLEPRKNVGNLVRAFGAMMDRPQVRERYPSLVLALAGGRGWDAELDGVVNASPVRERILRLGFLPDDALAGLLGDALVTAYPSLGEGFGLPVLEAMACGSPVLTTSVLSLPEVGGDVAVYSEPDAESIAAKLGELVLNQREREDRSRRGIRRAKQFSWSASARSHAAVFSSVPRGVVD